MIANQHEKGWEVIYHRAHALLATDRSAYNSTNQNLRVEICQVAIACLGVWGRNCSIILYIHKLDVAIHKLMSQFHKLMSFIHFHNHSQIKCRQGMILYLDFHLKLSLLQNLLNRA